MALGIDDPRDQWLPRADNAEWVYEWSNSSYSKAPKRERYRIIARRGPTFRMAWDGIKTSEFDPAVSGNFDFSHTDSGLVNLNYTSTPAPIDFPILCATPAQCGNSLAGALYPLIWGTRSPTLAEPLVKGTRWNSLGGAENDVASSNRYGGRARITVPAFPQGVLTARVDSDVTQAGALGDPFGSGSRQVYWVRGVGPVYMTFRHAGGELTQAKLVSTNQTPVPLPAETNLLPLNRGDTATFRWRNSKHMRRWSKQRFTVGVVVNNTARVDVKHVGRGPINVAGAYAFSTRLSGITHLSASTRAQTRVKFPKLKKGRRFMTPYDLMVFGFGPIVPVEPQKGETWGASRDSRDFKIFGVTGRTKVVGQRRIRTKVGRLNTTVVRSALTQRGARFGSGTRTMYFAAGKGLVRLVFKHRDGSTSTVERLKR